MYQSNNLMRCQNSITGFCLEKITLPYTFKWLIDPKHQSYKFESGKRVGMTTISVVPYKVLKVLQ